MLSVLLTVRTCSLSGTDTVMILGDWFFFYFLFLTDLVNIWYGILGTLGTSQEYTPNGTQSIMHKACIHNSVSPNHLLVGVSRKPKNLEETHTDAGRMSKTPCQ